MDIGFGKNVHERNLGRILREECDLRRGVGRPPWRFFGSKVAAADYCCSECQVISIRMGNSFFTGKVSRVGGSILKSESVAGMVPVIRVSFRSCATWNGTCL